MKKSVRGLWFCLLAGGIIAFSTHSVFSMGVVDEEAVRPDVPTAENIEVVRVDQVGYLPNHRKIAVVVVNNADVAEFRVRNVHSGEIEYRGKLSAARQDPNSGDTVRHADFTELEEAGRYVVEVPPYGASLPFDIAEDVYRRVGFHTGRSYTLARSATHFYDPITGLTMRGGHGQDAEAQLYFSDEFHDEGDSIDVEGGWYDAGDFGMYIPPSSVTVAQLMLAYESRPEAFYAGQLSFPPEIERTAVEMPDILEEVRFNLEWMLKMQRPDGAVYHKNSGARWPAMPSDPSDDRQTRYVFGLSTFGTAQFAGAAAMAARIYRPFDSDFADTLLEAAESAVTYLRENPEPHFRFDEGQDSGSGPYRKDTDAEERFWAAAELLKTTGDSRYERYLAEEHDALFDEPTPFVSWENALALGHVAYLTSGTDNAERRSRVGDALLESADAILSRVESDGYNNALSREQYTWASAKNAAALGNILLAANAFEPNAEYVEAALDQLHYVLGRNANSYSYLTELGTRAATDIHHRTWQSQNVEIPGLLVGGPNKNGGDPELDNLLEEQSPPPAKAYIDVQGSWATNEYAIDYTAPVFVLASHFGFPVREEPTEEQQRSGMPEVPDSEPIGAGAVPNADSSNAWSSFSDAATEVSLSEGAAGTIEMSYDISSSGWVGMSLPVERDASELTGIRVRVRGSNTGNSVRLEIRDGVNVHHEYVFQDSSSWRTLEVPFSNFAVRSDYQPEGVNPEPGDPVDARYLRAITFSPLSGAGTLAVRSLELY